MATEAPIVKTLIELGGFSILHAGNLRGERTKYIELAGLVEILLPNLLVLNGNLLPPCEDNPTSQIDSVEPFLKFIEKLKESCGHVLFMFAGTDTKASKEKAFALSNAFDISTKNYILNHASGSKIIPYEIIGCPYHMDRTEVSLKDWSCADGAYVASNPISETPVITTETNGMVLLDAESLHDHINTCQLDLFLEQRLTPNGNYKILFTQQPPESARDMNSGIGSQALSQIIETHPELRLVLCANEYDTFFDRKKWNQTIGNTTILQANQHKNILLYNYLVIGSNSKYLYHPLEKDMDTIVESIFTYNGAHENAEAN